MISDVQKKADRIRQRIQDLVSEDFFGRNVAKRAWPKEGGTVLHTLIPNGSNLRPGMTLREYRLQHTALESPRMHVDDLSDAIVGAEDAFVSNAVYLWTQRFMSAVVHNIEDRVFVDRLGQAILSAPSGCQVISLFDFPRRSLFGRTVYRYRVLESRFGMRSVFNKKYDRCPAQAVAFHPDIVELLFPDLENWVGHIQWREVLDLETNPDGKIGFWRLVGTSAVRPMHTYRGRVFTIWPAGIRRWIYKVVWKLLRIKS